MIIGTVGRLGKGKTLSGVIEACSALRQGREVFSNIWLGFLHTKIRTPYDFLEMNNGFFLGDELWALADNRKSKSLLSDIVTILCLRSRKRRFDVFYTQQYLQIDIRIRFITDFWIKPVFYPKSGRLVQTIYDAEFTGFHQRAIDARPYFNLYDTETDPYTLEASLRSEHLKEVLDKIYAKDSKVEKEILKLKSKALSRKVSDKGSLI